MCVAGRGDNKLISMLYTVSRCFGEKTTAAQGARTFYLIPNVCWGTGCGTMLLDQEKAPGEGEA